VAVACSDIVPMPTGGMRADEAAVALVQKDGWQRLSCADGSKGPRLYDCALIGTAPLYPHPRKHRREPGSRTARGRLATARTYRPARLQSRRLLTSLPMFNKAILAIQFKQG
jgi:hypothetical protein